MPDDFLLGAQNGSPLKYYLPENELLYVEDEQQFESMEHFSKIWYCAASDFDQELFKSYGYDTTYIYHGTIDGRHPYVLYLIQKQAGEDPEDISFRKELQ